MLCYCLFMEEEGSEYLNRKNDLEYGNTMINYRCVFVHFQLEKNIS